MRTWINAFLAAGSHNLVNAGTATGCPSVFGVVRSACDPVSAEHGAVVHTWSQTDYVDISDGLAPTRISVLPQVYTEDQAVQWANIAASSGPAGLTFSGVMTAAGVCSRPASGCTSLPSGDAYTLLDQYLGSHGPASATDLTVS